MERVMSETDPESDGSPPANEETPPPPPSESDVEELRRENVNRRRQLRAAEQANDELRGELERLRQELEQATPDAQPFRDEFIAAQVELAAHRVGVRRPAVVARLVSTEPLRAMETIEEIRVGAEAAVGEVLREAPELKGHAGDGLVTQGARSSAPAVREQSPDQWLRRQARRGR
jgi:hypothetical protein